jgi:enterochelin esterase-like enzyme
MKRVGIVLVAGALLAVPTAGAAARGTDIDTGFRSQALGAQLHYEVYLPPGYDSSGLRYPVIYFLHGLPSSESAYRGVGFLEKALDAAGTPAILVAPQGARAGQADPEYLDRGAGQRWETAISTELPRAVDARFRTIPSRAGRALIGVSAGGYGAMHIGLTHVRDYSVVESWSGYFRPTDPTGTQVLDLGSEDENVRADVHKQAQRNRVLLHTLPTFIAFYVGRQDARFVAENRQLNAELTQAEIPHVFRVYAGGHDQSLWQQYAAPWLQLALARLAPARA